MRRLLICATAVLATACSGPSTTVQCGACPGSSVALPALPQLHGPAELRAYVADAPCQTTRVRDPRQLSGLQPVALPTSGSWSTYDGTPVRVSLRSGDGRWEGAGTFEYAPPDGSPCDCGRLVARISLTPAP